MLGKRRTVSMTAPPKKKRKSVPAIEEIKFDLGAREDYLTGFHKRKLQRAKRAKEEAEKREREEKITARKLLREERKADLEKHVAEVNSLLRRDVGPDSDASSNVGGEADTEGNHDEWEGIGEDAAVDRETEYMDEDLHTTVTVEAVEVSRDGLHKTQEDGSDEDDESVTKRSSKDQSARGDGSSNGQRTVSKTKPSGPKKKKKKFRYESKAERKITKHKERSKNSAQARDRKSS